MRVLKTIKIEDKDYVLARLFLYRTTNQLIKDKSYNPSLILGNEAYEPYFVSSNEIPNKGDKFVFEGNILTCNFIEHNNNEFDSIKGENEEYNFDDWLSQIDGKILVENSTTEILDLIIKGDIKDGDEVYLECSSNIDQIGSDDDEIWITIKNPITLLKK